MTIRDLPCGCWVKCRCVEKAEAAKAVVILKLADLPAEPHVEYTTGIIGLSIQPYQKSVLEKGKWRWRDRAFLRVRYTSIANLRKGVNKLLKRKMADPDYLAVPTPLTNGEFYMAGVKLQRCRVKKL